MQTPREREQTNAQHREHDAQMRAQQDLEVRVQGNTRRRDQYAQQPAEERAQVNDGRRETRDLCGAPSKEPLKKIAATSVETLKPPQMTSNSTLWENCASHAANVKFGSTRVK